MGQQKTKELRRSGGREGRIGGIHIGAYIL